MRVVVRPVNRVEHPAVRGALCLLILSELFGEDRVFRKPFGDQRAEHPFNGDVRFGDEVDGAFLRNLEAAVEEFHLNPAGFGHGLDGRRKKKWVHRCFNIRTSVPPSRVR